MRSFYLKSLQQWCTDFKTIRFKAIVEIQYHVNRLVTIRIPGMSI